MSKHNTCPICKKVCDSIKDKHRHIEEKHDGVKGSDELLTEITEKKDLLVEDDSETMIITSDDIGVLDVKDLDLD